MRKDKKAKKFLTMLLSVIIIFTMSSYGNLGVYAEEDATLPEETAVNDTSDEGIIDEAEVEGKTVEEAEEITNEQPNGETTDVQSVEEITSAPIDNSDNEVIIESEEILNDSDDEIPFDQWFEAVQREAANADYYIGPDSELIPDEKKIYGKTALILPGETIAIVPSATLATDDVDHSKPSTFNCTIIQFSDDNQVKDYLYESNKTKATHLTVVNRNTIYVPWKDRERKGELYSPVKSNDGEGFYNYDSLYRNDTGFPIVIKTGYGYEHDTARPHSNGYPTSDCSGSANFQAHFYIKSVDTITFLENSYDIGFINYVDQRDGNNVLVNNPDALVFPDGITMSTKFYIDNSTHTYTFPKPYLSQGYFANFYFVNDTSADPTNNSIFNNFYGNEYRQDYDDRITFTVNIGDYIKKNGITSSISADLFYLPYYASGYTLELHAQGGTIDGKGTSYYSLIPGEERKSNCTFDLYSKVPIRNGFNFLGWCADPDNPEIIKGKTPSQWMNSDGKSTILYAVWEEKPSFTVTFEANGGTGVMDPVKVYEGDAFILPACGFTAPNGKTFDSWDKGAVGESITVTANISVTAKWKDKPADEPEIKTAAKVEEFSADDISDGIKAAGYTTVDAVEKQLRLVASDKGFDSKNSATYEVKLQISTDNGATWIDATPDNFPANGLTVKFDYPEGTDSTYDFVIVHMFGESMNGHTAGQTETFSGYQINKKADGIYITVTGLSPFLISWKEGTKETDTTTTETTATTTETTTTTTTSTPATVTAKDTTPAKQSAKSPTTGDSSPIVPMLLLLLGSVMGMIYLRSKKHI